MPEISGEHLIEIRTGSAKPPMMRVRPGEPLGPMSVGSEGAWRLDAPGVSAEHAEIYFDGKELFVRSTNAVIPAIVDGRPVPDAWTPVSPPCEIVLGDACIGFAADERAASAPSRPAETVSREGMFEDDDNVATRVAEPTARNWGDVGALVQRGIDVSRAKRAGDEPDDATATARDGASLRARLDALRRGVPRPAAGAPAGLEQPPFFPPAPPAPEPPEPDAGPSKSGTTDNSAMTRIEPVDQISAKRKAEEAIKTSGSYPQATLPSGSYPQAALPSSSYPQAALPSGSYPQAALPSGSYPQAALPSGSYPQAALPSGSYPQFGGLPGDGPQFGPPSSDGPQFGPPPSDGPRSGGGYGSTMVLTDALSSQSGSLEPPSSQPMFGAPPTRTGGTPVGMPAFRQEQPTSMDGLEGMAPQAPPAKSGWQEMSLPKKMLAVLFVPMMASVVVIFMGEDLGLVPGPSRPTAAASAKPSATQPVPAAPSAAPTAALPVPGSASAAPAAASGAPDEPPSMPPPPEPPEPSSSAVAGTPSAAPSTGAVPDAPAAADTPEVSEKVGKSGKTLQREAADAVAAGAYSRAAELYAELAKKHPNKPAYAEAAHILREKAKGSR